MLRQRIELLERVLRSHGIDADASVAQLMAEKDLNNPPDDPCASYMDDLCVTFDGALTIDESLNFDQDGEVRYFGPTSGRLLFRSPINGNQALAFPSTVSRCANKQQIPRSRNKTKHMIPAKSGLSPQRVMRKLQFVVISSGTPPIFQTSPGNQMSYRPI